jgi:hypothetical protein
VAIDDTDFRAPAVGKDSLLVPRLLERGYVPVLRGRQTILFGTRATAE